MVVSLVIGSGCIDIESTAGNFMVNEGPAVILHYEDGNLSMPINVSQIEIRDPENFTANVTAVVAVLLGDRRTGVLLENGWNITTVWRAIDEHDPNRTFVDVEFQKEGLSFFIRVDDYDRKTLKGYCGAQWWISEPVSGSLPQDYHQATDKSSRTVWVFDQKNSRVAMIYNQTTIFYLYPSYAIIDTDGLHD